MPLNLRRYEGNPVLKGIPGQAFHSKYIYNAGAAVHDGKIVLVYRAEGDYERPVKSKLPLSMLGLTRFDDGFHFTISPEPFMRPQEMSEDWGIAWLDLDDPSEVISRPEYPILEPETDHEKKGLTVDAVYSCGAVEWNGQFLVYYGAADAVLGVATASIDEVLAAA